MPIGHSTGVALDAGMEEVAPSPHPLFNFHTDDIDAAYLFVQKLGYEISQDVVRFRDIAFFQIKDPDGNVIMICNG
ncbi:VOC family protein [Halobacillus dabanensis]|uniref:VOC family protein n=1 Tax=Halobacillus dabanensis TaxID=240302 RepID=UPI001FC994BE|nr:VOC family protein [Halobacillus dabanensis]